MRTSELFGAKYIEFFEIYGVSARTRGDESVWTFCGQGGSQFFAILCRRPLWTAPNSSEMLPVNCKFISDFTPILSDKTQYLST